VKRKLDTTTRHSKTNYIIKATGINVI